MESEELHKKILIHHVNVRQSISILLFKLIILDIIAAVIAIFYFSSVTFAPNTSIIAGIISFNALYFILLGVIKIFFTVYIILSWLNEYYEISPHRIVHRKGFFKRDEEEVKFTIIKALKLYQGVVGRLFNFGTIELYDERRNKRLELYLIHDPHRHVKIIESLIHDPNEERHTIRPHFFQEERED